jgi:rod shape-determining protein MreC
VRGLNHRQRAAAIVLAAVAFVFITLDVAGTGLSGAHSGARGLLGSLYRGTDAVVGPVRRFVAAVPDVGSDRSRIAALAAQNAHLRQQLAAGSADAATLGRLNRLQLAADATGRRIMPARVIAYGPGEGFDWTATIDAGSSDGVVAGQTVTDGDGLVGRILHADADTSVVLLAADPGSGVGVRDGRNGQLGVATGAGSAGFSLSPLDPRADLKVGDELQSGPAGQSTYVAGLPVGTITSVHVSADGTTVATVKPATSPTAIDVVGVILAAGVTGAPNTAISPEAAPR